MSSLADVVARLRAAVAALPHTHIRQYEQELTAAETAVVALTSSTRDPDPARAVELLSSARADLVTAAELLVQASAHVDAWIVGDSSAASAAPTHDVATPATWKGKNAVAHLRDLGRSIGRQAKGSKRIPTREVPSVAELGDIFHSLVKGASLEAMPTYEGRFYRLPDGSTVGWRVRSRSSPDPTLDLAFNREGLELKIHVNPKGWPQEWK